MQGTAILPSTEPQNFAFVKIDLGSCYSFVLSSRLPHSLYIQAVGFKARDIISERGNPCCKRSSKKDTAQGRILTLIPKSSEQGLQSEDIEETGGSPAGPIARSQTPSNALRSHAPLPYSNRFLMLCNHTGIVGPRAFHLCWRLFDLDQIQLYAYCPVVKRRFSILSSDLNFPFCICRLFSRFSSVLFFLCVTAPNHPRQT